MHPKNVQNRSSTLGRLHLNPMHILRNVFTSRISSRSILTAVSNLFFSPGEGVLCINLDRGAHLKTFSVYPKDNKLQISTPKK